MMMAAAVSGDGEDSGGVDECGGISVAEGGSPTIFSSTTQIPDEIVENLSNHSTLLGAKHAGSEDELQPLKL